jgi:hypothetical protein
LNPDAGFGIADLDLRNIANARFYGKRFWKRALA